MPDPMANVEIEDVLSSIRRLVSEDSRFPQAVEAGSPPEFESRRAALAEVPEAGETAGPAAGRLVLTPALRVEEGEAVPAAELDEESEEAPAAAFADPKDDPARIWALPLGPTLEETIAELEAAVAGSGEEFEPDGGDAADDDAFGVAEEVAEAGLEEAYAEAGFADADLEAEAEEEEAGEIPDSGFGAEIAAAPAAALPRLHLAQPVAEAADAPVEAGEDFFEPDEEGVLDEELLRELVIGIVRQELQGTLGERITRNVRKLVRREIQQALASRDFE